MVNVSTPGQGEGPTGPPGGQPYQPNPPGTYGSTGQPPPYGAPPPYAQQPGQFAYNPYGSPYPAGLGDDQLPRASRPGLMVLSLVLLCLSALPFLLLGVLLLAVPLDIDSVLPTIDPNGQLAAAGITPDQLESIVRVMGGLFAGLAAIYILFAVLAFTGKNWARIVVALLTAGFALMLLAGLVTGGAADGGSLALVGVVLIASIGGTVILFLPDSQRFFANPKR